MTDAPALLWLRRFSTRPLLLAGWLLSLVAAALCVCVPRLLLSLLPPAAGSPCVVCA